MFCFAVTATLRGVTLPAGVFLTAFFEAIGFRADAAFLCCRCFDVTLGLAALRAGALAVATFGLGRADFAFSARFFADFSVVRRAVLRDVERLRPFARVLMN